MTPSHDSRNPLRLIVIFATLFSIPRAHSVREGTFFHALSILPHRFAALLWFPQNLRIYLHFVWNISIRKTLNWLPVKSRIGLARIHTRNASNSPLREAPRYPLFLALHLHPPTSLLLSSRAPLLSSSEFLPLVPHSPALSLSLFYSVYALTCGTRSYVHDGGASA